MGGAKEKNRGRRPGGSGAGASVPEGDRRFRELLEDLRLVAVTLDSAGRVTFCNDFLLRLTGWGREEVTGRDWFDTFLPAEQRAEQALAQLPAGRGQLVLVVDDEEAVRQITKGTLEAFGYRVLVAADGTEAVALYAPRREEIACVVTDMMMPFMDGLATVRALRRMNPAAKIISASGLGDDARAGEAARLGVRKFLPKPYTAEALLRALAELLAPSTAV